MILDLLFPNRCLHCNRIIEADLLVCGLCFGQIHFTHYDYSKNNPVKEQCKLSFPVENAYALIQFEKDSLSRKIIHELKYKSREIIGKILAEWTIERLDFRDQKPELLVSVPLHPKKQRERGYNQLHLYTEALSKYYKIPFDHQLIKRNYYSKAQALKDKKHRQETVNTFSVTKPITEKHILLIDDVFTTGTTVSSIAWEILNAGDNKVSVLVMAMDV
ncbi:putative competence protein [Chryseobacterium sp. StRB126]|uniref:ComF family protein n=1 Tax=Chryseobacterium sp. StRB126 TaxID=878220 RepID=UPI0004E9958F|nr:ComF family protein [Chryseobacterium sp. StRB126]BAP33167.1 putative competence protein [Chryseobacterium sp. StRB126]